MVDDYNNIIGKYGELFAPSTLIKNGRVFWRFNRLDSSVEEWSIDIDAYRSSINWPDPTEIITLKINETGEIYTGIDLTNYVQSDFFTGVISSLTDGNTDREFVAEVVNLKKQLVTYETGLTGEYRWSAETLTEGCGNCGDTSILMASLLKSGENQSDYGLEVYFWYCDAGNMTNPQEVNHVIVEVVYSDDDFELIETTSDMFYTHDEIEGWRFEV